MPLEPEESPEQAAGSFPTPEDAVLEARLARLRPAPARPAFKAELRRRFSTGEFAREGGAGTDEVLDARPPRGRLFRVAVPLAAAAAILAVTFLLPEEPRWDVRDFGGEGTVRVAGVELESFERDRLEVELTRGAVFESRGNEVALDLAGTLRMTVLPGTRVEVSALPEPGTPEPLRLDLSEGEVFLRTLAGYPGNPILVHTPEADVRVTGTTLGVLVVETGTCVCVAEGEVVIDDRITGTEATAVKTGSSLFVFDSGEPARVMPFADPPDEARRRHVAELERFADA